MSIRLLPVLDVHILFEMQLTRLWLNARRSVTAGISLKTRHPVNSPSALYSFFMFDITSR
jgi:hypothetical protein